MASGPGRSTTGFEDDHDSDTKRRRLDSFDMGDMSGVSGSQEFLAEAQPMFQLGALDALLAGPSGSGSSSGSDRKRGKGMKRKWYR
jgi:hypothetical protein